MKNIFLAILLLGFTNANASDIIKSGSIQARSDGTNVTIQWGTNDESGVKEFSIERRTGTNGQFMLIATLQPKGNNSLYEFVDQSAFKADGAVYQYRIKIVDASGNSTYSSILTVSHNVSSVKRTWGSLKAMFR